MENGMQAAPIAEPDQTASAQPATVDEPFNTPPPMPGSDAPNGADASAPPQPTASETPAPDVQAQEPAALAQPTETAPVNINEADNAPAAPDAPAQLDTPPEPGSSAPAEQAAADTTAPEKPAQLPDTPSAPPAAEAAAAPSPVSASDSSADATMPAMNGLMPVGTPADTGAATDTASSAPVPTPPPSADLPAIGGSQPAQGPDSSMAIAGANDASGVSDARAVSRPEGSMSGKDIYYDNVPTTPMGATGPRKINPELEPASRFIVVKQDHEASDTESMLVAANRALKLGRYDAALDMFNQLYEKNSHDPRILMGRAVAQQNSNMTDSAIQTYQQLLDINPDDTDAMLNMLGLIRAQYPSVALRQLLDLSKKYPDNAGIAAQIGVTQADLGDFDDAMKYLGMAASLEPQNAQHVYNMAIVADRHGSVKQAVQYYEQALQIDAVYGNGRSIPRDTVNDRLAKLRQRL
jgi:Flp pilus assembly protein TadD